MQRQKIAILFGGCSPEYGVSLQSAFSVITNIDRREFEPILLGITRSGEWFQFLGDPEKIRRDVWNNPGDRVKAVISPCRGTHGILIFEKGEVNTVRLDAALPVLHGKNGEDGTVQGLLELAGIPVAGCGTCASALCMDKDKAHKIAEAVGVGVPRSFTVTDETPRDLYMSHAKEIAYPLFVKPVRAGSSYGITKVFDEEDLPSAVKYALEYDSETIIEENISGFEIGCAVLGGKNLTVGEIDEIELSGGFFDYEEKYTLKTSGVHVPARISNQKALEAKETAKTIYRSLGCSGFARVDMFLTPSGEIVFNEVNTVPGFTEHSRYPNMLKARGMTLTEIITAIIRTAVNP